VGVVRLAGQLKVDEQAQQNLERQRSRSEKHMFNRAFRLSQLPQLLTYKSSLSSFVHVLNQEEALWLLVDLPERSGEIFIPPNPYELPVFKFSITNQTAYRWCHILKHLFCIKKS
jgi:hypothetical protein